MPLWEPLGEQELLKALRQSKQADRAAFNEEIRRAVDYLEGIQKADVEQLLLERYSKSQMGDAGQTISPVTLPITERYVAEAANAYNQPVTRELVNEAGEVQEDATKILRDELEKVGYDEHMHLNERLTVLMGVSAVWYQVKRGKLRPVVTAVDDIYPVAQPDAVLPDGVAADPKDPDDYAGFIVQLVHAIDDVAKVMANEYALVTPAETIYYKARDPYAMQGEVQRYPNPYRWPQVDYSGKEVNAPLQMVTFWHKSLPTRSLLRSQDIAIVDANRELNIQWSLLFDTLRLQGWATTVMNLMNPEAAPSSMTHGARFPLVLSAGETASSLTYATPYGQIVDVLKTYSRLLAVSLRMSPSDFSIDQAAAASGFAKLVDSLPKIEARRERLARLKHMEEQVAWPRIGAALAMTGALPEAAKGLQMRVSFAELEFPKTPQEEATEFETEFKHGLSSPVDVIMKRKGVTKEEAEEILQENKASTGGGQQQQPPFEGEQTNVAQPGQSRGLFAALIRQRQSKPEAESGKDE